MAHKGLNRVEFSSRAYFHKGKKMGSLGLWLPSGLASFQQSGAPGSYCAEWNNQDNSMYTVQDPFDHWQNSLLLLKESVLLSRWGISIFIL